MPDDQSAPYRLSRWVVIFRTLTPARARFARVLAVMKVSVLYLEATAPLRRFDVANALAERGIHQADYSRIANYDAYAHVKFVGELAAEQVERLLPSLPLERAAQAFPPVADRPRKIRALLHELISDQIWREALCHTVAARLRLSGHRCFVWPANSLSFVFLSPRMSLFERAVAIVQAAGSLGAAVASRVRRRVRRQPQLKAQAAVIPQSAPVQSPPASSALVLMFPHKGPFFGTQVEKDQYYSADPHSPLHRDRVLHVELADALIGPVREEVLASYRGVGIEPYILGIAASRRGLAGWWQALRAGQRSGLPPLASLLVAVLLGRVERAQAALSIFPAARLALLGYDYLFPLWIAYALQARGIVIAATQERLIQAFLPYRTTVIDEYFVHGKAARDAFNASPYVCVSRMHVIGDVRTDELAAGRAYRDEFPRGFRHRTLVLDWHSDPDPFNRGHHTTNNWPNNRLFFRDMLRLARDFPDSYFLLRGKNADWLELADFADIRNEMNALPNISVSVDYSPRAVLDLAAVADSVVARYTSLGDQSMAAGKPVIYHEGSANGGPLVASVLDFAPYRITARSYDELATLYRRIRAEGRVLDEDERLALNEHYFSAPLPAEGVRSGLVRQLEAMIGVKARRESRTPDAVCQESDVVATGQ